MIVRNYVIPIAGMPAEKSAPAIATYPPDGATHVFPDAVVKLFFSRPVRGVTPESFTLSDSRGVQVPAGVDQIGDGAWGLFPSVILLKPGEQYTARLRRGVCDLTGACTSSDLVWHFRVSPDGEQAMGDASIPDGFTLMHKKNDFGRGH